MPDLGNSVKEHKKLLARVLTRSTGEAPLTETGIYSRARLETCNVMGSADCVHQKRFN